jgi:hypothetical protein
MCFELVENIGADKQSCFDCRNNTSCLIGLHDDNTCNIRNVRGTLKIHGALSFESYSMVRYFLSLKFLGLPNSRVLPLKTLSDSPESLDAPDLVLWSGPRSITEPLLQASISLNLGTVPQPVHHVCCDSPNCFLGPSAICLFS